MERIQGSPRVANVSEYVSRAVSSSSPKGCVPLGIYRVEETKGLIDGMGTVGLQGVDDHNGSIKGHDVHSMPPWEVTWSNLEESKDLMGINRTYRAIHSVGCPNP